MKDLLLLAWPVLKTRRTLTCMTALHFSFDFDNIVFTPPQTLQAGVAYVGPKRLLSWLEGQLGLNGYPENTDYLRIELYRQALLQWLENAPVRPFYAHSFEADRFATAAALLSWRDELWLSGWDFSTPEDCPPRLAALAATERIFRKKTEHPDVGVLAAGFADRYVQALQWLEKRPVPIEKMVLYEPETFLPPIVRRLVTYFQANQIPVETIQPDAGASDPASDLAWLQGHLQGRLAGKKVAARDGSLCILRARRDSDAAVFLAQWLAKNPEWNPVFLIPDLNRQLEEAMLQEGFPAMGVSSASLARPSLQVLKLAPAFLWEPVDVFKIMEFVTLPLKPLDDGLALEIARVLAEKPGLFSDTWFGAVLGYLDKPDLPAAVRQQYEFWFSRRRYRADSMAPKRDALDLYGYLHRWAHEQFEESQNSTLLVLAEQARRIHDLLDALPEQRLGFLDLERIVRTIYEPAPVQLTAPETNRPEYVHHPGALAAPVDTLVWWNCLFEGTNPPPDRWQLAERAWLGKYGVEPELPRLANRRRLLLGQRPVLRAARRLILVVPEQADGAEALPHLLLSDIAAAFEDSNVIEARIDTPGGRESLAHAGCVPSGIWLESRPAPPARPHLAVPRPERLIGSEYETPTSLESLFFYPHRWFFRQKMRLFPLSLLRVSRDQTLLGNLAHRFFELLLEERGCLNWEKSAVQDWIHTKAESLLEREGATLLLYGREPERNQFLGRVKNSAWTLLTLIRANGWSIFATEMDLQGMLGGGPVLGKADLVLRRDEAEWAIVDLKWSGARRRKEMIQNGEDLQLILYAKLLPPAEIWAHTAYFILEDSKMIARNKEAFRDAVVAPGIWDTHTDACAAIFAKMERTYAWRLAQIKRGSLELRTARTAAELEALYAGEMLDLLEMKTEDSRWDDYQTLLDLGW
ncbi:MAG: hypothetical protein IPM81_12780 [Saprospirales bacterium]|nr:hypothetical protein [Saprospirales bacterium]